MKIRFFIVAFLFSLAASSQAPFSRIAQPYIWTQGGFDSLFLPAHDTTTPKDKTKAWMTLKGTALFVWDGAKWNAVTGPAGPPGTGGGEITSGTIAQLRAMSTTTGRNYTSTDILGDWTDIGPYDGQFADDGALYLVTANNKVLKRQVDGPYKAEWFGLVGDNFTDNTAAFRRMISKVTGVIEFDGTYLVSDTIKLNSNQTLRGKDKLTTIIKLKNNAAHVGAFGNFVFRVNGKTNVGFENITIDANGTNQPVGVIRTSCVELTTTSKNIRFSNVLFRDARTGPGYDGGYGIIAWAGNGATGQGGADSVIVENCTFEKIGQSAIGIFDGQDWKITNNTFLNNGYSEINIETETLSKGVKNVIVNGFTSTNCGRMPVSVIRNVNSGPVSDILISNGTLDGASLVNDDIGNIRIRGTERVKISNINIKNSKGTGVRLTVDSNFPINDLTLDNISDHKNGYYSLWAEGSASNQINNLTINNYRVDSSADIPMNLIYCNNLTINNANIRAAGGQGLIVKNSTGVNIQGGSLDSTIDYGLILRDVVGARVSGLTVKNNIGTAGITVAGASNYITFEGNSVFDTRTVKQNVYGFYSDATTVNPSITFNNNNFTRNKVTQIVFDGVGLSNVIRLNNIGDNYQAINTVDDQDVNGLKTFKGDGSNPAVTIHNNDVGGGSIKFKNQSNASGFVTGLAGDASGDYFIFNPTTGGISQRISRTLDHTHFGGSISGARATQPTDFLRKDQLDSAAAPFILRNSLGTGAKLMSFPNSSTGIAKSLTVSGGSVIETDSTLTLNVAPIGKAGHLSFTADGSATNFTFVTTGIPGYSIDGKIFVTPTSAMGTTATINWVEKTTESFIVHFGIAPSAGTKTLDYLFIPADN